MKAVKVITGTAMPLGLTDVDTDQIIPSDYLKRIEKTGFEKGLFAQWREDPEFILNNPAYKQANILVSGPNFGTGSSREHAVWALQQYGFDAVIAPSFGDIFRLNCYNNGFLPIIAEAALVAKILDEVEKNPHIVITIDVKAKTVSIPELNIDFDFPLDDSVQERFLLGLDEIAVTLQSLPEIKAFESKRHSWFPKVI